MQCPNYRKEGLFYFLVMFWSIVIAYYGFLFLATLNTVNYDNQELISKVKPEYLIGINRILYTDEMFSRSALGNKKENLGVYYPLFNIIKIDINKEDLEPDITIPSLLCHELHHHKWFLLSNEERQDWKEKYHRAEEMYGQEYIEEVYGGVSEFYAEWGETNWRRCYISPPNISNGKVTTLK